MNGRSTTRTCENCGQPVLHSDVECWHCGVKLKPPESEPLSENNEGEQLDNEVAGDGVPPSQIVFYAIMTAVTALALLLVVRSLGQQPRLSASLLADNGLTVELFAPDRSFNIELPAEFMWYFPQANRGWGDNAAQLANDPRFEAALQPLVNLAPDAQLLLLAQAESAILSIARSERLAELTVQSVVYLMANEPFPGSLVLEANKSRGRADSEKAVITLEQQDPPVTCRQHFLPDSEGAFLVSLCIDSEQFDQQSAMFDAILNSLTIR